MQIRSIASETARQSESTGQLSLAWFAADFREEMSAFDGAILVSTDTHSNFMLFHRNCRNKTRHTIDLYYQESFRYTG